MGPALKKTKQKTLDPKPYLTLIEIKTERVRKPKCHTDLKKISTLKGDWATAQVKSPTRSNINH